MTNQTRLNRIQINNYKNIAAAAIQLQPLTVLVGPNGAGKSNFMDALSFVADSLQHSIQLAFANRGGIAAVRRKSGGHPYHIGLHFRLTLADGGWAVYAFDLAARPHEAFSVAHERCVVQTFMGPRHEFEVENGQFIREVPGIRARIEPDRLALTVVSAAEEFRPVYDFLTGIQQYTLRSERLRALQDPDPGEGNILLPDGSNAAAVLRRIQRQEEYNGENNGQVYERICRLLGQIVPGTTKVEAKSVGRKETLEFRQNVGQKHTWRFDALNMSDGTLRALGILLAVYQPTPASLIAIEEPESTIHPAAAEILMDILQDGAERSQVLITTHSSDILDNKSLEDEQIVAVQSIDGVAHITPLTETTRDLIRQRLYTPGELLRQNEIQVDRAYAARARKEQLDLFSIPEDV
ncbi:MAG: AAA family ATPase [Chloroflexi bacterium]|jgi:predicted ATPase|nr:AAA family ATPase [Chloroflexota bacterium]